MFIITGKYNSAKVFTDNVDQGAISQITQLCNQEFVVNSKIRLMPDVHAGSGCTIGTTMTITDKIVPNLVGVDIGCGMETVCLQEKHLDLQKLDNTIYEKIPSGTSVRKFNHRFVPDLKLKDLACFEHISYEKAKKSIGTLGGGNHFIEVDQDEQGKLYLIVHSGSRHIGNEVAKYYQNLAIEQNQSLIKHYLNLAQKSINSKDYASIELFKKQAQEVALPKELCYLTKESYNNYIQDMQIIQHFALLNRKAMIDEIINTLGLHIEEQFSTIHNYIDTENMILRKGAVSAQAGEKLLIPVNMRDGSLICIGKGNEDWNFSAPHGAGRLMSRSQAKSRFKLKDFEHEMKNIFSSSVSNSTLDECPMAYKPIQNLIDNIEPTCAIEKIIKPIYNFKAQG